MQDMPKRRAAHVIRNTDLRKQDSIATVTINRPEKRNAWTTQVSEEIIDVFGRMEDDPEVLVTILTGSGDKAFSAGADLGNAKTHKVTTVGAHLASVSPKGFPVFNAVADFPKPVVAAINGFAVGIGCLITLCCDILLASDNAELGVPQVPLGILPAYGGAVSARALCRARESHGNGAAWRTHQRRGSLPGRVGQ